MLGLTEATFFWRVKQGHIPKVILPGKRQGVYKKTIIDALAQAMYILFESQEHIVFSRSNLTEQEEAMPIGIKRFGSEFITPLPERIAFQLKSEYTFWSLKIDGHVQGYVSMFLLPPDFLDDLLTGKRIRREITVREVLPFTKQEPFDIYVDELAMNPELPHFERVLYAGILITRFADAIIGLLANGYPIARLFKVTASREGENLLKKAGFHLMQGKSQSPGRIAYEFELDERVLNTLNTSAEEG